MQTTGKSASARPLNSHCESGRLRADANEPPSRVLEHLDKILRMANDFHLAADLPVSSMMHMHSL